MQTSSSDWPSTRLVDDVVDVLRERILAGRLAAGASLSQRKLAAELDVGRAIVGDALRELRWEGMVAVDRSGRGLCVAAHDEQSIAASAHAIREVIDGLAARLAASPIRPKVGGVLDVSMQEQRAALEAGDLRAYARADVRFHVQILEASGNRLLLPHKALLRATSRSVEQVPADRLRATVDEHRAICDAICDRDPARAERLARLHVRAALAAPAESR